MDRRNLNKWFILKNEVYRTKFNLPTPAATASCFNVLNNEDILHKYFKN